MGKILTIKEAEEVLAAVRRGDLLLDVSDHFWKRARERLPGFTTANIYQVIRQGNLQGEPTWSPVFENYKIKVRGRSPDHGQVELVLAISWFSGVCITVYTIAERN